MANEIIPEGYLFTANSWENDGDHCNTITKSGLSAREAQLLVEVSEILKARKTGLENLYNASTGKIRSGLATLRKIFEKYPDIINFDEEYYEDQMVDYITEIILGPSENYYFRVLDNYTVHYVPIRAEYEDVTNIIKESISP